ncbi:hypothetical protein PMIN01_04598 [Paraphaeosphaeria minitans]|uniref:Uncharacterized protein n=1 Tax=Paraphaeosphaeria minitans TaxID=565426 RepID=A0A9P6GMI3_9PLEO|nr:hypothetical protein PMIN01_04598 [Paraphaeosphaeria minitans]
MGGTPFERDATPTRSGKEQYSAGTVEEYKRAEGHSVLDTATTESVLQHWNHKRGFWVDLCRDNLFTSITDGPLKSQETSQAQKDPLSRQWFARTFRSNELGSGARRGAAAGCWSWRRGKAWLIYRWQTHIRAGAVTKPPRRAVLPGLDSTRHRLFVRRALALSCRQSITITTTTAAARLLDPSRRQAIPASIGVLSASDARAQKQARRTGCCHHHHQHQALCVCVRDRVAVKVSVQSRFDARSCLLCREHPCHPHGAPGSDDALRAGALSMPALLHHTLHVPQLPRRHPPISLLLCASLGLPSSSPLRACEKRHPLA